MLFHFHFEKLTVVKEYECRDEHLNIKIDTEFCIQVVASQKWVCEI